jgi:hypothetical protein
MLVKDLDLNPEQSPFSNKTDPAVLSDVESPERVAGTGEMNPENQCNWWDSCPDGWQTDRLFP